MSNFIEGVKAKWDATCEWIDEHKIEVGVGLGLVLVFIGGVWVVKNGSPIKLPVKQTLSKGAADTVSKFTPVITESIMETSGEVHKFTRSEFVRKLPEGWRASAAKMAEAAEKGIVLQDGETLVDACTVTRKCA